MVIMFSFSNVWPLKRHLNQSKQIAPCPILNGFVSEKETQRKPDPRLHGSRMPVQVADECPLRIRTATVQRISILRGNLVGSTTFLVIPPALSFGTDQCQRKNKLYSRLSGRVIAHYFFSKGQNHVNSTDLLLG